MNFIVPLGELQRAEAWVKAEALLRAKGGRVCNPATYDFSNVPEAEARPCVYYEYSRESARVAESVDLLREQMRESLNMDTAKVGGHYSFNFSFRKVTKKHGFHYDAFFLLALAGCSEFPNTSWSALPDQSKKELMDLPGGAIQMHNRHFLSEYPVFISDVAQDVVGLEESTLQAWIEKRTPKAMRDIPEDKRRAWLVPGFFMVNFVHPPDRIVESFRKWLLKRHPRASEPVPEKRGRNSHRDRLNALGAMRLRFYCRALSEAQNLTAPLRKKENGLYYSDRTAWNRACGRAVDYFREVLDASEKDLPIHHSEGWQK